MARTLLVDGDIVVYQSCSTAEHDVRFDDGVHILMSKEQECMNNVYSILDTLKKQAKADEIVLCLSSSDNFRKELADFYKGNRVNMRKPLAYRDVELRLMDEYTVHMYPRLEGDDVIGIMATNGNYKDYVIWSEDKDLMQIPGKHLVSTFDKAKRKKVWSIVETTKESGHKYHMEQTLTGDVADNYKGCPGIGAKTAEKILSGPPSTWWSAIVQQYEKKELTEEDALLQARLAFILQDGFYDFKKHQIKLWSPA